MNSHTIRMNDLLDDMQMQCWTVKNRLKFLTGQLLGTNSVVKKSLVGHCNDYILSVGGNQL